MPKPEDVVLDVVGLQKKFQVRQGWGYRPLWAVWGVSFSVKQGEIFGLVGESGCGKSTVARCIVKVHPTTGGRIVFMGHDITHLKESTFRPFRAKLQLVFQDPSDALNPRMTVRQLLREPLQIHMDLSPGDSEDRIRSLIATVGLNKDHLSRYPHQLSTGQQQRVGVARALICEPTLVILDEPTSALDVSVRGRLLRLLKDLQAKIGVSYVVISHDLAVIGQFCHHVSVMYLGMTVEAARTRDLFTAPLHPYTRALISAIPIPDPRVVRDRIILRGEVPSPLKTPTGCPFNTRCPEVIEICRDQRPELLEAGSGRKVACHRVRPTTVPVPREGTRDGDSCGPLAGSGMVA